MDVHKIHYRQTSGIIERVDIAKMMIIQENNLVGKYAGMKIGDIQLDGKIFLLYASKLFKNLIEETVINCIFIRYFRSFMGPNFCFSYRFGGG